MKIFKRIWNRIRFGKIYSVTKGTVAGHVCEVAYYGRNNKLIGWWAYGYFDPNFPYRGD